MMDGASMGAMSYDLPASDGSSCSLMADSLRYLLRWAVIGGGWSRDHSAHLLLVRMEFSSVVDTHAGAMTRCCISNKYFFHFKYFSFHTYKYVNIFCKYFSGTTSGRMWTLTGAGWTAGRCSSTLMPHRACLIRAFVQLTSHKLSMKPKDLYTVFCIFYHDSSLIKVLQETHCINYSKHF